MLVSTEELAVLTARIGPVAALQQLKLRDLARETSETPKLSLQTLSPPTSADTTLGSAACATMVSTEERGTKRSATDPPLQWQDRRHTRLRCTPIRLAFHGGQAVTTAAAVVYACRTRCEADPRVTGKAAEAAAKAGRGFTSIFKAEVLRRYEMTKLANLFPDTIMQSFTGLTASDFAMRTPEYVADMLFAQANAVAHGTIRKARLGLARLLEHMHIRQIPWGDAGFGDLPLIDLFGFLMDVHVEATSNTTNRAGGLSAVWGAYDGLALLVNHFTFQLPTATVKRLIPKRGAKGGVHALLTGALPLPPAALQMLCDYAADAHKPPVLRSWARAAAFTTLSSLRQANSQNIAHYFEISVLGRDYLMSQHLDGKSRDKQPVVFITPLQDTHGSREWFDATRHLLWEKADFLWASHDGEPSSHEATLLPMPLSDNKIQAALRLVLREACHMSVQEAAQYTKHSLRKTMVCVAQAAGCPWEMCIELGHWSHTCLDKNFLVPAEDLRRKQALACMKMPQRYSANTRVRRVARIIGNQVDRMQQYLQSHPHSRNRFDTKWELMRPYSKLREGA